MFRTNQCVLVKLLLIFTPFASLARKGEKKNITDVLKLVALMPVKGKFVKYLTAIVNYLHAIKILQILMKKYIFSKKPSFSNL